MRRSDYSQMIHTVIAVLGAGLAIESISRIGPLGLAIGVVPFSLIRNAASYYLSLQLRKESRRETASTSSD